MEEKLEGGPTPLDLEAPKGPNATDRKEQFPICRPGWKEQTSKSIHRSLKSIKNP